MEAKTTQKILVRNIISIKHKIYCQFLLPSSPSLKSVSEFVIFSGSPYTINCIGQGMGTVSESVSKQRNSANAVLAGQECELYMRLPNTSPMDLLVRDESEIQICENGVSGENANTGGEVGRCDDGGAGRLALRHQVCSRSGGTAHNLRAL